MKKTLLDEFMRQIGRSKADLIYPEDAYQLLSIYSDQDLDIYAPTLGYADGRSLRDGLNEAIEDFFNQHQAKVEEKPMEIPRMNIQEDDRPKQEKTDEEKKELIKRLIKSSKSGYSEDGEGKEGKGEGEEKGEGKGEGKGENGGEGKEGEGKEGEGKEGEGKEGEGKEGEGKEGEGKEGEGKEGEGKEGQGPGGEPGGNEEEEEQEFEIDFDDVKPGYRLK